MEKKPFQRSDKSRPGQNPRPCLSFRACTLSPERAGPPRPQLPALFRFSATRQMRRARPFPYLADGRDPQGHPLPSARPRPCLAQRGKREGTGSRSLRGRDSLCPYFTVRAKPPSRPRTPATRTLPCPMLSVRVTSPWPCKSTHQVPTTLTLPTACGIQIWHHQFESRLF
jgi:hypothetical protein